MMVQDVVNQRYGAKLYITLYPDNPTHACDPLYRLCLEMSGLSSDLFGRKAGHLEERGPTREAEKPTNEAAAINPTS